MSYEYEGEYGIVWNNRDVEMNLYADLDCVGDIADIKISNAHYIDNNEPVAAEEIEAIVIDYLSDESPSFWGIPESNDEDYPCGMDCVDWARYQHGEEF